MIDSAMVDAVRRIARAAAGDIRQLYDAAAAQPLVVQSKVDDSPLTAADLAAHHRIVKGLRALTPSCPVVSEEAADVPFQTRRHWPRFWLVDPLDGTREFLSRNGEFTVNIALIEQGRPVFGVVLVPIDQREYWGVVGQGAWCARSGNAPATPIRVVSRSRDRVCVLGSRSHRGRSLDEFLARVGPHEFVALGSSLKLCRLAEGDADVYPRLGPTSEWDIAAGHAVLLGAGGRLYRTDGTEFLYNDKTNWINPPFIAFGPTDHDWVALLNQGAHA